jgi:hypothetical protein
MTDRFAEVQPGQPGWYWHHNRVVEVVRDGSGNLWTRWEDGQRTATRDLPEGPRCIPPSELAAWEREADTVTTTVANWLRERELITALQAEVARMRPFEEQAEGLWVETERLTKMLFDIKAIAQGAEHDHD